MFNDIVNVVDTTLPYMEWFWRAMFYIGMMLMTIVVSYNLNKELHKDIFKNNDE